MGNLRSPRRYAVLCAALSGSMLTSGQAWAQTPDGGDATLGEIVVTAQRREASLQDTPVSVAAFDEKALAAKGIANITDLRTAVPNLQLSPQPNAGTTSRVFIRGIGNSDDQITQDPSVAVYQDGVYVGRSQGLATEVADLERIEVLRGPQGSLYGRNATGGAINFITRQPDLGRWSADGLIAGGSRNLFRLRAQVNVPIGDTLAVQAGYVHNQQDGFVDNAGTGVKRFGDVRRDAYRAAIRWKPADAINIRYAYDRSDIGDTPIYLAAVPLYPAEGERPDAGSPFVRNLRRNHVLTEGHTLLADYRVSDGLTIKSITGYRRLHNRTNQNYLTGAAGPFPLFTNQFNDRQHQFSEELQALGTVADRQISYIAGFYYFDESARSRQSTTTAAQVRTDRSVTADNAAYALYGQLTYSPEALGRKLHVTVGARYTRDARKATLQDVITQASGTSAVRGPGMGDNHFHKVTPTAILAYDAAKDVNLYVSVTRGYKSGGFNVRASTIDRFEQGFGPESLTSYEAGLKSEMFGRRMRLNVAAFRSDYRDIQLTIPSDPTNPTLTDVLNAGKARVQGVELDLTAKPVPPLTLSFSYSYLDTRYQQVAGSGGSNIASLYHFAFAPKNSINAGASYRFPDLGIGTLTASADYSYRARVFAVSNDNRYVIASYGLLDARLTLDDIRIGATTMRASVFGKNLTNTRYYTFLGPSGLPAAAFGDPRTFGVELGIHL